MRTVTFQSPDGRQFAVREQFNERREWNSKVRAYVWGEADVDDAPLRAHAAEIGVETIYTRRDRFPSLDKLWDAHNREIVRRKREILDAALAALVVPAGVKATFSRKAGCSCGCSPGFVIDGLPRGRSLYIDEVKPAVEEQERTYADLYTAAERGEVVS